MNAILSHTDEFQYKFEACGSQCRMATEMAETMDAAENSTTASLRYADDSVDEEVGIVADVKESLTVKVKSLDALRAVQAPLDASEEEELEEASELAKVCGAKSEMVAKELGEATAAASASLDAMSQARRTRRRAKKNEENAKAEYKKEETSSAEAKAENVTARTATI